MSKWQVLLVKEIKHLFRDTKTIVQTVVVPTFITPLLIGAIFWYVGSIATEETKKTYDISVYSSSDSSLIENLDNSDRLVISKEDSVEAVIDAVTFDESEIGLVFGDAFSDYLLSNESAQLTIYSKDIDTFSQAKSIVSNIVDDYEENIRNDRLELLNLDENYVNPNTCAQNVGKVWINREKKTFPAPFGAIPGNFLNGPNKNPKFVKTCLFSLAGALFTWFGVRCWCHYVLVSF